MPILPIERIIRRQFPEQDRAAVQESVAHAVETDPNKFLVLYRQDPRSHAGRYVNSDLVKEIFPEYAASAETRNRFNSPVHNSAAVLASAQYRCALSDNSDSLRRQAILLTGIPGAGKTMLALANNIVAPEIRVVYEGQLANPAHAIPKVEFALAHSVQVEIVVVHISPEQALANTLTRFEKLGRGAGIEAMARIQGELPAGLDAIYGHFGRAVGLTIVDRRATIVTELAGWQHLDELRSEGNYEDIKQRLRAAVNSLYQAGRISHNAYNQALGNAPAPLRHSLDQARDRPPQRSEHAVSEGLVNPTEDPKPKDHKHEKDISNKHPGYGF